MNNAVIYARYSSAGQNEQSIEGQLRICKEFAESKGFNIVKVYMDKAKSAWSDSEKRVDFNKMLTDAPSGTFQNIIVYKFDRFSRNRTDSMIHKARLKKEYGIKVLSATEPVSDDEGGEIYEMFLEWNDEKYSQRLSKRVRDGITTSVANGTYCGGSLNYGYKIRQELKAKYLEIDQEQADVLRFIFEQYANNTSKQDIADKLNAQGHRYRNKPFTSKTFDLWLRNEKYTGTFEYGGRTCENMYSQIIDKALFNKVQEKLDKNKYFAGGTATAREPYLLTGKLFCGECGTEMVSDGGTGKCGKKHHYYACKKKKKAECVKSRESKDRLERRVVFDVLDYMKDQKIVDDLAERIVEFYNDRTSESEMKSLNAKIQRTQDEAEKLTTKFIEAESKLLKASIEKRMTELETYLNDLEMQKSQIEIEKGNQTSKADIMNFIEYLMQGDIDNKDFQKSVIDNLIYKVFIIDKQVLVLFILGGYKHDDIDLDKLNKYLQEYVGVQTLSSMAGGK
ncbi:MAG: recombinase family protein [Christensenellaceae bacterium]|nr:recombinase family protein [Christensenellaceae bacterium]